MGAKQDGLTETIGKLVSAQTLVFLQLLLRSVFGHLDREDGKSGKTLTCLSVKGSNKSIPLLYDAGSEV